MAEGAPSRASGPPSGEPDPASYTNLPDLFRSWFWRYYDQLWRLILVNVFWFFAIWVLIGLVKDQPVRLWPLLLYLPACVVSFPCAFLVFRYFTAGSAALKELPGAFRRYFLKAMGLSVLSGLVLGAGVWNILFYLNWQEGMRPLGWGLTGLMTWLLLFWVGASLYQWPLLFFQNPPFLKILYRSFLLFMGNSWTALFLLAAGGVAAFLFTFVLKLIPWVFLGPVFFFSLQCMALEKHLLRYRITFEDAPLTDVLERLDKERNRSWREFFKPWEAK